MVRCYDQPSARWCSLLPGAAGSLHGTWDSLHDAWERDETANCRTYSLTRASSVLVPELYFRLRFRLSDASSDAVYNAARCLLPHRSRLRISSGWPAAHLCCSRAAQSGKRHALLALQEAAKNGPRETLVYLPAVVADHSRPDYLATVDVDPESSSYGQARGT
ncbi:uncharacterized protein HaLaN_27729 [Haematococcus lacustris]|uniref:Uncharacterized protein n=1 Tax=Haematococcus lacustris TaxID=44745 RepID=A0A6A0A9M9_HAELA|nr:uncharacterized protein HaLaN_27729 [Haematococcus lacustris]